MICFRCIIVNTQHEGDKYRNGGGGDEFDDDNRRTAKTGQDNEETANHPWTASLKGRNRLLVRSQKTEA
jgi:hypothetical protein